MINFFSKKSKADEKAETKSIPVTKVEDVPKTTTQSKKVKTVIIKDITGRDFGDYRVVGQNGRDGTGHVLWKCECRTCGDTFTTTYYELTSGRHRTICLNCANENDETDEEVEEIEEDCGCRYDCDCDGDDGRCPYSEGCDLDDEEEDFCDEDAVTYSEEKIDLFSLPVYYHVAHCIPADLTFYGYTASEINRLYAMQDKLYCNLGIDKHIIDQYDMEDYVNVGDCLEVENVYNLIPNPRKYTHPTEESLLDCVHKMAKMCYMSGVKYLAMPRIGCGSNGLNWDNIRPQIIDAFIEEYNNIMERYPNCELETVNIVFCYK